MLTGMLRYQEPFALIHSMRAASAQQTDPDSLPDGSHDHPGAQSASTTP
jgi:hypothetical protein